MAECQLSWAFHSEHAKTLDPLRKHPIDTHTPPFTGESFKTIDTAQQTPSTPHQAVVMALPCPHLSEVGPHSRGLGLAPQHKTILHLWREGRAAEAAIGPAGGQTDGQTTASVCGTGSEADTTLGKQQSGVEHAATKGMHAGVLAGEPCELQHAMKDELICRVTSLQQQWLVMHTLESQGSTAAHAHTHARTHARTHTHTQTDRRVDMCLLPKMGLRFSCEVHIIK